MKVIALFITAVLLWITVQREIDSQNPCSAFSASGECSSGSN